MSKVAEGKCNIQIRIDKEVVRIMDGAVEALNKNVDVSKGEKWFTRSMFIENVIKGFFVEAFDTKFQIEKAKKGENNNA